MKTNGLPCILTSFAPTGDSPLRHSVNKAYAEAVAQTDGVLCMLASTPPAAQIPSFLGQFDGFLLPGGSDIEPTQYGQQVTHSVKMCRERDSLERALLASALKKRMPVLAICRGMQLLNVHFGGTLWQDVLKERPDQELNHDCHDQPGRNFIAHEVTITAGTGLRGIIGVPKVRVNSLHHQGINKLGNGLTVSAVAPDGLVEGVEVSNYSFVLGVQWHPEEIISEQASCELFKAFIRASWEYRQAKR